MRKCIVFGVAALAALSFTLPSQASAQGVFLGAGATIPMGDYDYADPGWMLDAGVTFPINENGLYLFVDGMFGSNKHGDFDGDKTNLLGGFGGIEMVFAEPGEAGPFVFGQVGFLKHDYKSDHSEHETSDNGLAFGGGAGYSIPIGGLNGWVLGRYILGKFDGEDGNTTFLGVSAGVSIPLGGGEG